MSSYIPLENVSIATPCRADWNLMQGDDRARFCGTCQKNVYNISVMSRADAETLILEKEGKLCVRFYQRGDGTIITDNCPVGLKLVRKPFKWLFAAVAAGLAWGATMAGGQANSTCIKMGEPGARPIAPKPKGTSTPEPTPTPKPKQKREVKK